MMRSSQNSSSSFGYVFFVYGPMLRPSLLSLWIDCSPLELCAPELRCNLRERNAASKYRVVCTDAMVQIYLEGKCSISWAF